MRKKSLFIQPLFKTLPALTIFTVVGVITSFATTELKFTGIIGIQPAIAQFPNSGDIDQIIYQKIPDLPRENQYISKETKKVATNNTLVSRIISYHNYVKRRPPNYRLDWKLTLADYLGANEMMYEKFYPGNDTLKKNPLKGDRAAIKKLNRRQRNALVQALVDSFSSN
ncbi:hypothetical protein [Calothrix rhizosoleniae]|uniref:hypothetical protein n=1 Tax=Calothrix rhizosoleniae TaxID=888997 RepID=UPI000B4A30BC|nr:hypothetical protein [Calothrix rhizosoleniae]